ncbi:MAG: hypothetical protein M3277_08355 [Actinomycetota bacterium]|nr:hypothetical protein [Actinomycetota bacterium]
MAHYRLAAMMFIIALMTGVTAPAGAIPNYDPAVPGQPEVTCNASFIPDLKVVGTPIPVGYPVVGFTVEIDLEHAKFHGSFPPFCGISDFTHPLPSFGWNLVVPAGSAAFLSGTDTLRPQLELDAAGIYLVQLTPCPGGCVVAVPGRDPVSMPPFTEPIELSVTAVDSAPLGPETMPEVVSGGQEPRPRTDLTENNCGIGAGATNAQWWTAEKIHGPQDYRKLEGSVLRSRVSRKDNPLNHDSQDAIFDVIPDPAYRDLLFSADLSRKDIEVEWERFHFPERYRPTAGDRVSVFGHWIYDCAHAHKAEIHPPVGLASHRPRPILIPREVTFPEFGGQPAATDGDVWVPGIVSDIFFSDRSTKLLRCGVDTGLKNELVGFVAKCPPAPSIKRVYEFNIFVPPNPQMTMRDAGIQAPDVPLYVETSQPPGATPADLTWTECIQTATDACASSGSGTTYLRARLDLTEFPAGKAYQGRIAAGWVLPSSDNWGLDRWKLRLNALRVTDDGDGTLRGDGDWRLWVNTNNASNRGFHEQEWINILDCSGCISAGGTPLFDGVHDFGGVPWETGPDSGDRSLGPDLLRYPPPEIPAIPGPRDYRILFHSTGFEADWITDDDAGTVFEPVAAMTRQFALGNTCQGQSEAGGLSYSGCVRYVAEFEVLPGNPLPRVVLSAGAASVRNGYVLSRCNAVDPDGTHYHPEKVCKGIVGAPIDLLEAHPFDDTLVPGTGPVRFVNSAAFRPGSRENSLTEMTITDLYEIVTSSDIASVDAMLEDLRATWDEEFTDPELAGEDGMTDLKILEVSLPRPLWARHFGDLRSAPPNPGLPTEKVTGSGVIGTHEAELSGLMLHCDLRRRPNHLTVRWGDNRFDLDLMMDATCSDSSGRSTAAGFDTHRGMAVGRFNGTPGAVITWTFVDKGEPGGFDSASVTILTGRGGTIQLHASGHVLRGNLQATK